MPSTRSSRRAAAITARQQRQPRASSREIDPMERKRPVAPLPPELAAAAAADRELVEARRQQLRTVIRQVESRKRQAKRDGDLSLVTELVSFGRRYEAAMRRIGSLDRFPS